MKKFYYNQGKLMKKNLNLTQIYKIMTDYQFTLQINKLYSLSNTINKKLIENWKITMKFNEISNTKIDNENYNFMSAQDSTTSNFLSNLLEEKYENIKK